jgi:hypothetical protein
MRAPIADVVLLKAGRHQLTVSLDRHETAMRVVDITAGGTTELTINLAQLDAPAPNVLSQVPPPTIAPTPPPGAAAPATPPPAAAPLVARAPESEASPNIPAGVWIAGGVTFAALLTSILTGQLALAADRDFNSDLATVRNMGLSDQQRASAWDDGIDAADRAHTFAVATDVLLSCAVVGAVLTTVLYVNASSSEPAIRQTGSSLQLKATF